MVNSLPFLLSLHGAAPLKTGMKMEPGHYGAPGGGPLADAATRSPPSPVPSGPRPRRQARGYSTRNTIKKQQSQP